MPSALTTNLPYSNRPPLTTTLPLLSSRAKPRDLQFCGLFLETLNSLLKQICHLEGSAAEKSAGSSSPI